jgi:hypothetical protein
VSQSIVLRAGRSGVVDYVGKYLRVDYVLNKVWVTLLDGKGGLREFPMVTGDEVEASFRQIKFRTEEPDTDTVYFTPAPAPIRNDSRFQETQLIGSGATINAGVANQEWNVNDLLESRCLHAVFSNLDLVETIYVSAEEVGGGGLAGGGFVPVGPQQKFVLQTGGTFKLTNNSAANVVWSLLGVCLAPPRDVAYNV